MGVSNGRRRGCGRVDVSVSEGWEITGDRPSVQCNNIYDNYERKVWVWAINIGVGMDMGVGMGIGVGEAAEIAGELSPVRKIKTYPDNERNEWLWPWA